MNSASHSQISMPHSETSIKCSNPHCQAYNKLESRFCHNCKTPVVKCYLWSIEGQQWSENKNAKIDFELAEDSLEQSETLGNQKLVAQKPEEIVSDRYVQISDRIFLDTQPGETPQIPNHLPPEVINYLQLFAYFPYIPQIYGQLDGTNIWLLDYGTVPIDAESKLVFSNLLPTMASLWNEASPCRQIKWLRQIISLWKPLSEKGLVTTLLNPQLVRINGASIQLMQLEKEGKTVPNLQDLGKSWKELAKKAHLNIQNVLVQLSQRMASGSIDRIEQIVAILDRTLDFCARSYEYSYETFAISDSGPTRENNQDTAYPNSTLTVKVETDRPSLAIVCDGVGGHEGGEIASQETVDYLQKKVSAIDWNEQNSSLDSTFKQLIQFTNEANDAISKRNDSERREERQRMGTTLVMSIARNHEVFMTHIGDSRIYLITKNSCHQITTDDDLASREVRLGYAVYRDALRYPSAGALIQALGMRNSTALHPNVERLLIDDDCLLLLCSDGLSDFDRVEQYWRDVILPVLDGRLGLKRSVETLIKIGNKKNGHDNITVALVHCQVKAKSEALTTDITWSQIKNSLDDSVLWTEDSVQDSNLPNSKETLDTLEKPLKVASNIQKKQKILFVPLVVTLSITLICSLGILLYAKTKNNNESQSDSPQSQSEFTITHFS